MIVNVTSGIWLQAGEERIVKRIAGIVCGHADAVRRQDDYAWCLNYYGNDWFAGPLTLVADRHATIEVFYRYEVGPENSKMMEGLRVFLDWLFQG